MTPEEYLDKLETVINRRVSKQYNLLDKSGFINPANIENVYQTQEVYELTESYLQNPNAEYRDRLVTIEPARLIRIVKTKITSLLSLYYSDDMYDVDEFYYQYGRLIAQA